MGLRPPVAQAAPRKEKRCPEFRHRKLHKIQCLDILSKYSSYSLNLEDAGLFNHGYVHSLLAFGTAADFEFDCLPFVERLETVRHDTREMNEDFLAVLSRNESVAFLLSNHLTLPVIKM